MLTGVEAIYVLTLKSSGTGITDAVGNALNAGAAEDWFYSSTTVVQSGNTVTITDVGGSKNGGNTGDRIILAIDPENSDNYLLTYEGHTFSMPLAGIDNLIINGLTGDDKLTLDFANGELPFLITFNGGVGGNDTLEIINFDDSFTAYTINYDNSQDGTILFRNGAEVDHKLDFTGLDPITIDGTPTNIILNLASSNDNGVILEDVGGADGIMYFHGTTFEKTTFSIGLATSITINGNGGNDNITVKSIDSTYTGSLTINGGDGNDVVNASAINLPVTLIGGNGNDSLTAGKGNDELSGGAGNDTLDGKAGTDCVFETITATNAIITNTSLTGLGIDKLTSIECVELEGNSQSNLLDASKFTLGRVQLLGLGGNDTLLGTSFNDVLDGGDGFDVIKQSAAVNQTITDNSVTGAGTDSLISIEGAQLIGLGRTGLRLDASGFSGKATLNGTAGNDTLLGGNSTSGGTLNGNAGNDSIDGGSSYESISGGEGSDYLFGDSGDDRMFGDAGGDRIFGGNGQDLIDGGDGNDTLLGESGHDTIKGGTGNDGMSGGAGDDFMDGESGDDTLLGGSGSDTLRTAAGRDRALGEEGNDRIESLSDDTIFGGAGDNIFIGPHAKNDEAFVFDFSKLLV